MIRFILPALLVAFLYAPSFGQNKLTGYVKDQQQQEPIEGVHVFVPELQKGTITDGEGRFVLRNLPDGHFKVQFTHIGYKNIIRSLEMPADTGRSLTIWLESTVIESEAVVVSAGSYSTQHENAIKIEMLSTRKMNRLSAPSLMGKLARIPGVDVIGKGEGVSKPVIRGLTNSNILVLNNGVKLENFQFSENHPFMIDEFGVDRVEVIKGPASLLYGSDAVGGIINIIREKPASEGKVETNLTQKYHSNTHGYETNLGVKGTHNDFFWGLRGGLKSHADYISGTGHIVPNTQYTNQSVHAFTGLNKPFGSFKLYYDFYSKDLGMSVPGLDSLVDKQDRTNKMWYQDLANHMILSKNAFYLDPFKLEADLSFQSNHRQLITRNQTGVDMLLNTFSADIKGRYDFNGTSELIVGAQAVHKENNNADAPNRVLPDHQVRDLGLFGLIQHRFSDRIKAQAGIRWDHRGISMPEQPRSGHSHESDGEENHEAHLEPLERDYQDVSASLGATWRWNSNMLMRANLASGYRTPNVAELTQEGIHGNRYEQGNRNLNSQSNYEADISFHYHCCHALLDVSGFYNHINDYIFLAPTGQQNSEGFDLYRYQQNNAYLYGGEITFEVRPVRWFDLFASFSRTIGKRENQQYLPFIPQSKLKSGFRLESGQWGILENTYAGMETTYALEQNNPSRFETPTNDYFLINLNMGVSVKLGTQKMEVSVMVDNLLDKSYVNHLSTLKPLGYFNMGRNVIVSLTLPFEW